MSLYLTLPSFLYLSILIVMLVLWAPENFYIQEYVIWQWHCSYFAIWMPFFFTFYTIWEWSGEGRLNSSCFSDETEALKLTCPPQRNIMIVLNHFFSQVLLSRAQFYKMSSNCLLARCINSIDFCFLMPCFIILLLLCFHSRCSKIQFK